MYFVRFWEMKSWGRKQNTCQNKFHHVYVPGGNRPRWCLPVIWWTLLPQTPIITCCQTKGQTPSPLFLSTLLNAVKRFQRNLWAEMFNWSIQTCLHFGRKTDKSAPEDRFLETAFDAQRVFYFTFARLLPPNILWTTSQWSHRWSFPALWAACPPW